METDAAGMERRLNGQAPLSVRKLQSFAGRQPSQLGGILQRANSATPNIH